MQSFATLLFLGFFSSLFAQNQTFSHNEFDSLLHTHVTEEGCVDYQGFIQDSITLNHYLNDLSNHPADAMSWSKNDQMAYWINAYNAFTIQLICRNYPLKSIKDIGGNIYRVNTTWDIKFIQIGDEQLDLNNIEHQKLRAQFDDARIHFAIVCASISCPKLLNEAYVGEKLDMQLDIAAQIFLEDNSRNQLSENNPKLSLLFKWYKMDFTKTVNMIEYINQYATLKIDQNAEIDYLEYDWGLNEQKK